MKVLVTGATGFIGRNAVERLRRGGEEVRCLVRDRGRAEDILGPGLDLVRGHLDEESALRQAVRGMDGVLHVAGVVRAWRRETYFRVNARGTENLVRAARRGGVRRFVLVSSLAASGPADSTGKAVTEESAPRPLNAYGQSKLAGEEALRREAGSLSWLIVRPSIVYGPGDRDVLQLFRLASTGFAPYTASPGARFSLVHVDDLSELLLLCLRAERDGRVYLASDGEAHAWPDLIGSIGRALGRRVRALRVPPFLLFPLGAASRSLRAFRKRPPLLSLDKLRESMASSWVASCRRAKEELGWSPRIPLDEGVRRTAAWYRERGWLGGSG